MSSIIKLTNHKLPKRLKSHRYLADTKTSTEVAGSNPFKTVFLLLSSESSPIKRNDGIGSTNRIEDTLCSGWPLFQLCVFPSLPRDTVRRLNSCPFG